jgi:hypothetical protein
MILLIVMGKIEVIPLKSTHKYMYLWLADILTIIIFESKVRIGL